MSAAFDTIDRQILLDILERIVEEDELRIIRFLLSDTAINTRINGATKERPFESNIGTPQGDSLSPVLFSIYLENVLKEVRNILPRPTFELEKALPTEIAYADNVDFVGLEFVDTEEVRKNLREIQSTGQCRYDRTNNVVKSQNRVQKYKESWNSHRRRRRRRKEERLIHCSTCKASKCLDQRR